MTDRLTPEQRHKCMSHVKEKNTRPELAVRKLLWSNGYRYRLHCKELPGKPDIVFPGRKKVLFVHGCFWHYHKCNRFKWPKTNAEFWAKKIHDNVTRDKKNLMQLKKLGWRYLVIWECELKPLNLKKSWMKVKRFLDAD